MARHGKKYIDAIRRFDRQQLHQPVEAVEVVKSVAKHNFDETVEAAFRLGVDPRKADQMIRGTVSLPNGTGKSVRVAVFATGDAARDAQEAGADVVGSDDLVARIQNESFLDFDVAIATPDLMGQVGRLGLLGLAARRRGAPAVADFGDEQRHCLEFAARRGQAACTGRRFTHFGGKSALFTAV